MIGQGRTQTGGHYMFAACTPPLFLGYCLAPALCFGEDSLFNTLPNEDLAWDVLRWRGCVCKHEGESVGFTRLLAQSLPTSDQKLFFKGSNFFGFKAPWEFWCFPCLWCEHARMYLDKCVWEEQIKRITWGTERSNQDLGLRYCNICGPYVPCQDWPGQQQYGSC